MKEKDFQTKYTKWLRHNPKFTGAFELKLSKKPYISFKAVLPHQIDSLLMVKHNVLPYKISDDSRGFKPFDCFSLSGPAYVVIQFYRPGHNIAYAIDIDVWCEEEKTSTRKSLTEDRASEIGIEVILGARQFI